MRVCHDIKIPCHDKFFMNLTCLCCDIPSLVFPFVMSEQRCPMLRNFTSVSSALLLLLQNYVAALFTTFNLVLYHDIDLKCRDKFFYCCLFLCRDNTKVCGDIFFNVLQHPFQLFIRTWISCVATKFTEFRPILFRDIVLKCHD